MAEMAALSQIIIRVVCAERSWIEVCGELTRAEKVSGSREGLLDVVQMR